VVFGEADEIPSLILDRFGDVWVFQSLSAGLESFKSDLIDIIRKLFSPTCLVERNDVSVREKEELPKIRQVLFGNCPPDLIREIEGFKFIIDPLEGQKTGFFLDQRFNAKAAGPFFRGRLLDCFCHSGQFSIQAAGQTEEIVCVDQSETALEQVKKNAALNEIHKITVHQDNVFDFLKTQYRENKKWDGIVLDPPAFVKSRSAFEGAVRGYKEINLRALKLLKSGGRLATFSCSQNLSREKFLEIITMAGEDAGRPVKILTEFSQPPDHPRLLAMPESNYLKGYLLQVD
jgi:23S rRNA (cytosine1962-C5)-methyltransferase